MQSLASGNMWTLAAKASRGVEHPHQAECLAGCISTEIFRGVAFPSCGLEGCMSASN